MFIGGKRVQDVNLAYAVPANLVQRVKVNNMRVFVSARNLFTFTKWPGWDPEGWSSAAVPVNQPMPKTFTVGLNMSL